MPQLIVNQALAYTSPPPQSFSETEFEQWGFSQGQWTWTVAGEEQAVSFGLEQGELVLSADYGTFRGGAMASGTVLVLAEEDEGPGPPNTTWVNIARRPDGNLDVAIQMRGGDSDEPTRTQLRRLANNSL